MLEPGQSRNTAAIITSDCVRFFYEVFEMLEKVKDILIEELLNAKKEQEVPVAAVIVFNNEILCSAHNERVSRKDVTAHAEVLAIKKAAEILGDWRLNGCKLYVSLEPCAMCKEIIKESRIAEVFYFISRDDDKRGFYKSAFIPMLEEGDNSFQQFLSDFFKDNCNR